METMMIFLSSHFTWLVELKKSLQRQRRLPRSLLLSHLSWLLCSFPIIKELLILLAFPIPHSSQVARNCLKHKILEELY